MNRNVIVALVCGALFGVGLVISRMVDPRVILAFLDVFGRFDPSLLFVMTGAVMVTTIAFRFVLRLPRPMFENEFRVPTNRLVDRRLILGAAIFGVGWGLAGYCPGPVLVALAGGAHEAWWFVPAMVFGGWLQRKGAGL